MRVITHVDPLRRPVRGGYLSTLRRAIAQLGDGYASFRGGLSRARRREFIRQVFARYSEEAARSEP